MAPSQHQWLLIWFIFLADLAAADLRVVLGGVQMTSARESVLAARTLPRSSPSTHSPATKNTYTSLLTRQTIVVRPYRHS